MYYSILILLQSYSISTRNFESNRTTYFDLYMSNTNFFCTTFNNEQRFNNENYNCPVRKYHSFKGSICYNITANGLHKVKQ